MSELDGQDFEWSDELEDAWHELEERRGMRGEFPDDAGGPESDSSGNGATSPRFTFIDDAQLDHQPMPDYLVDGLLVRGSFGLIVGAPGSLKSFLALDLLASIRTGRPWAGRAVTHGLVAYILAEGRGLFSLRVRAWKQHHGLTPPIGLRFLPEAVQLTDRAEVAHFIRAVEQLGEPLLATVFDTYARCAVGVEENSAKDTGLAVAGIDRIRAKTGTTALVLHHTPRGEERERGSAALRAATDTLLAVTADGDFVTVTCQRQKDIEEIAPLVFRKQVVTLDDGRTSCVLVPVSAAEQRCAPEGIGDLPASVRAVLDALRITDKQTPSQLLKTTDLSERTIYRALTKAADWHLVDGGGKTPYRITPMGRALYAGGPE